MATRRRPERGHRGRDTDEVLLPISGFSAIFHLTFVVDHLSLRVFQPKGSHFFLTKDLSACLTYVLQTIADLDST